MGPSLSRNEARKRGSGTSVKWLVVPPTAIQLNDDVRDERPGHDPDDVSDGPQFVES
jgi:hypothetical protein